MIQQESLTKCKNLWRKILTYANGLPWVSWFWKWAIFCHFFVAWLHFVFSNLMLSFMRIYIHISRWEMSQIFFLVNSLWLQVLGLFFAMVLRAVSASAQRDYAIDEDYLAASSSRQPAANRQPIQAATPNSTPGAPSEARSPKNDAWSTRMRDKVLESWLSCYVLHHHLHKVLWAASHFIVSHSIEWLTSWPHLASNWHLQYKHEPISLASNLSPFTLCNGNLKPENQWC